MPAHGVGRRALSATLVLVLLSGCDGGGSGGGAGGDGNGGTPPADGGNTSPPVIALGLAPAGLAGVTAGSLALVSSRRAGRTLYDYSFTVRATNSGAVALQNVTATVTSAATTTVVMDGALSFGDLAAGASATSIDTFTIRQDRLAAFSATNLTITINPPQQVATVTVSPASASIAVGQQLAFTAEARDQNGALISGAVFTWSSSKNSVATVANGIVAGVATGYTGITASSGGVAGSAATLTVTPNGTSTSLTSEALIDQDLQAGTITDEQAFIYRVYAAFGSPSLPAAYKSDADPEIDSPINRELGARFASLSPAAQAALKPYLIPPIYAGSWGDPDLVSSIQSASTRRLALSAHSQALQIDCTDNQPGWVFTRTAHFKIWHQTVSLPNDPVYETPYTPEEATAAAANIAAVAEFVYTQLTGNFGKTPLSDANEPCNGGDDAIDVFMTQGRGRAIALTATYPPGCAERPTWMWISPRKALDPKDARDIFAHEFMHMIDFAYSRGSSCEDYVWLGEAAGNWAIDFVYHDDQYEQVGPPNGYARYGIYAPCYYQIDYLFPLEQTFNRWSGCNGYADYVFLSYLSNKLGPAAIRRIFDFAQLFDSLDSLDNATSAAGGLKKVWPDFVTAGWNDWQAKVADDFYKADKLVQGRKGWIDSGASGSADGDHSLPIDLKGAPEKTFTLDQFFGGESDTIEPLAAVYIDLKFPDDAARTVTFNNKPAGADTKGNGGEGSGADTSQLAVWALLKINGQWRPKEDWTKKPAATFCRDAKAERIEELVVIYSNSSPVRPRESSVIRLNGNNGNFAPTVAVSNIGCWRWEGTASVTTNRADGLVTVESATVTYRQDDLQGTLPDSGLSLGYVFFRESPPGTVDYSISGTSNLGDGCRYSGMASGPGGDTDGLLVLFRVTDPDPRAPPDLLHRAVIGSGVTTIPEVTVTITCPDSQPETITNPEDVHWLSLPDPDPKVSDDGQTITGRWERDEFGDTKISVWNLHSVRE